LPGGWPLLIIVIRHIFGNKRPVPKNWSLHYCDSEVFIKETVYDGKVAKRDSRQEPSVQLRLKVVAAEREIMFFWGVAAQREGRSRGENLMTAKAA